MTVWPDGTSGGRYRFQHALYQQVLYESLGTARRVQLHQRIGARLEAGYGARAGEIAAQLAVHFERGGEVQRAVHYWQQAGDNATRRNAHHEAVAALTKGLALLATLPESPARAQHELTLLLILGELLMAAKGARRRKWVRSTPGPTPLSAGGGAAATLPGAPGPLSLSSDPGPVAHGWRVEPAALPPGAPPARPGPGAGGPGGRGAVAFFRGDLMAARAHLEHSLRLCDTPPPSAPPFHGGHAYLRVTTSSG